MKRICCYLIMIVWFWPSVSMATSGDECAIWLCAPQGFAPSSCKPARKAMTKRIFKGKQPLPALASCMVNSGGSNQQDQPIITATQGFAAKRKHGEWAEIRYCSKDLRRRGLCSRSISISVDGKQEGETYYFNEYEKN